MSINQKVYTFVIGQLGTQVGNGECFTLADQALRQADAKSASDYGAITGNADYRWGNVVSLRELIPGDIIQFRNFEVVITTVTITRTETSNGGWSEESDTQTRTMSRPHHTAIVGNVRTNGEISVLEQNIGTGSSRRTTQRNTLYFQSYTAPSSVTRRRNTTVTVRSSAAVTGDFWFYRPQPTE